MKTVICLIPFSDGVLSMYKGEIASIDETKATALIASGYVAEYSAAGGGNIEVVNVTFTYDESTQAYSCAFDKTFDELLAIKNAGKIILCCCTDADIGSIGEPCFLSYYHNDLEEGFSGCTDISAGVLLGYNEFQFSIDETGAGVDVYAWDKVPHDN